MTEDCSSNDYARRWFLALSNIAFALPIIQCLRISPKRLAMEIFFMSMTMVVSFLYHLCDSESECTRICFGSWTALFRMDFIFSYEMFAVVMSFSVIEEIAPIKFVFLSTMLLANTIFVLNYRDTHQDLYYLFLIVVCILVTAFRFLYLHFTGRLADILKNHFNVVPAILGAICAVIGITCKFVSDSYNYWFWHSWWHIFIALAACFTFAIYQTFSCCCCRSKSEIIISPPS